MDETTYAAVPVEPTLEMLKSGSRAAYGDALEPTYRAMLAAAPKSHVAVKRELLERIVNSAHEHGEEYVYWTVEAKVMRELIDLLAAAERTTK